MIDSGGQSNLEAVHNACQLISGATKQDAVGFRVCAILERTLILLTRLVSIAHNGCVNFVSHQIAQNDKTLFGQCALHSR